MWTIFQLKYEQEISALRKELQDQQNVLEEKAEEVYNLSEQIEKQVSTIKTILVILFVKKGYGLVSARSQPLASCDMASFSQTPGRIPLNYDKHKL